MIDRSPQRNAASIGSYLLIVGLICVAVIAAGLLGRACQAIECEDATRPATVDEYGNPMEYESC